MAVSLPGGRGRSPVVDLNLVPFVDFLSCLIAFLMMSAVMVELHGLPSEQSVGGGTGDAPAPLTVHVSRGGLWVGREAHAGTRLDDHDGAPDWTGLEARLVADRMAFPDRRTMVLNVDDDVGYGDAAAVMDLAARLDYAPPLLAGGPPAGR